MTSCAFSLRVNLETDILLKFIVPLEKGRLIVKKYARKKAKVFALLHFNALY